VRNAFGLLSPIHLPRTLRCASTASLRRLTNARASSLPSIVLSYHEWTGRVRIGWGLGGHSIYSSPLPLQPEKLASLRRFRRPIRITDRETD
jgi:hypothetical protein